MYITFPRNVLPPQNEQKMLEPVEPPMPLPKQRSFNKGKPKKLSADAFILGLSPSFPSSLSHSRTPKTWVVADSPLQLPPHSALSTKPSLASIQQQQLQAEPNKIFGPKRGRVASISQHPSQQKTRRENFCVNLLDFAAKPQQQANKQWSVPSGSSPNPVPLSAVMHEQQTRPLFQQLDASIGSKEPPRWLLPESPGLNSARASSLRKIQSLDLAENLQEQEKQQQREALLSQSRKKTAAKHRQKSAKAAARTSKARSPPQKDCSRNGSSKSTSPCKGAGIKSNLPTSQTQQRKQNRSN